MLLFISNDEYGLEELLNDQNMKKHIILSPEDNEDYTILNFNDREWMNYSIDDIADMFDMDEDSIYTLERFINDLSITELKENILFDNDSFEQWLDDHVYHLEDEIVEDADIWGIKIDWYIKQYINERYNFIMFDINQVKEKACEILR